MLYFVLSFVICSLLWNSMDFFYELSINECKYWTRISLKGQTSIFQRRKPSKLWPNMVMAKDVSHTFSGTSKSLVARTDFFCGSLLHPRGQLWAESWRSFPSFDGWKWPSNSKMAKFDHKNGHNPKVTFGQKFALRILSQEYSSELI